MDSSISLIGLAVVTCIIATSCTAPRAADTPAATDAAAANVDMLNRAVTANYAIAERIDELLATSPHPLFTRHLRSVRALVATDLSRCMLLVGTQSELVKRSVEQMEKILQGLNGDAGQWDSYAAGRRSMIFAFVSRFDRTLQQYSVRLPADWDPEKAYPAIVYLHGSVPKPDPLWHVGWSFGPGKPQAAKPADAPPALEPHFSVAPWGRGNAGYRGDWEGDVWEALGDAQSTFKIDPDRLALAGHSMGGYGSWSIAINSPDVWSAVCIYAGGDSNDGGRNGLVANIAHLPVYIWHGAKDKSVPIDRGRDMIASLKSVNNEPVVVIDPEAGHMPPSAAKAAAKAWLLEQRRQRPGTLKFATAERQCPAVWGISMRRDPAATGLVRFTCKVEGQTVRIDTEAAAGMRVQLGAGGLGLTGEVTVIWNGEQAYQGPAELVKLGKVLRWPRRRR